MLLRASHQDLAKSELAPSTFNGVTSQLLYPCPCLVSTSGGWDSSCSPSGTMEQRQILPRPLGTMEQSQILPRPCLLLWRPCGPLCGRQAPLTSCHSVTHPPLIINSSTPGGCHSWHTLGLVERQQPVFTVLHPATGPFPPPTLMVLLSGIPPLKFTQPKPQTN